jgi:head-tail adaptor
VTAAGSLDRRVRFEKRASISGDGEGNYQGDWEAVCIRAASVLPKKTGAGEIILAGRLSGRVQYTIVVRSDSGTRDVTPDCRAVDTRSGEIFNIRSVLDLDGRRQWLTMDAETGVAT